MRRLFWVSLGATAGALVVRKLTHAAQAYSPDGVATSLSSLGDAVRDFAAVVREGMDEREQELRVALGVETGSMDPATAREVIDHPTAASATTGGPTADRQD